MTARPLRQGASKRRLTPQAHGDLVAAIRSLPDVELHVAQMERLSKRDQMALISRADVVVGVHGNGLTNEIWMKPGGAVIESASLFLLRARTRPSPELNPLTFTRSPRRAPSPPSLRRRRLHARLPAGARLPPFLPRLIRADHPSLTVRLSVPRPPQLTEPLNHSYFPIWNDRVYDWAADAPGFKLSENFQSSELTVSAPLVKGLIEDLLRDNTVVPNRPSHNAGGHQQAAAV